MVNGVGTAVLTVIAVLNNVVSFTGFLSSEFPQKDLTLLPPAEKVEAAGWSMVRVVLALNGGDGPRQAEGPTPAIVAFDENKKYIGASNWLDGDGFIDSGGYKDIWIFQRQGEGRQATYLQILGHDNGVCVAYITQQQADGTGRGFLGDMGRACGKRWYYSNIIVGDNNYRPDCVWLNRDGDRDGTDPSHHSEAAAMQIHMEDFTNTTASFNPDPTHYCTSPTLLFANKYDYKLKIYNEEYDSIPLPSRIHFWTEKDAMPNPPPAPQLKKLFKRRNSNNNTTTTKLSFRNRIITSAHDQHSARALCEDMNSQGPSFVSWKEGLFCDMRARVLWPVCGPKGEEGCFDGVGMRVVGNGVGKRDEGEGEGEVWVERWE